MSPPPRYATVGSLAKALRDATVDLRTIERDVDDFLSSLFPGWQPLFPASRGWGFTAPDAIDVYGVVESPAATTALHRAGFRRVTSHGHARGAACSCSVHTGDAAE